MRSQSDRDAVAAQCRLDSLFRLLRQDLVQPMLQALCQQQQQQQQQQQAVYGQQLRLENARVVDIKCKQQTGGCAHAVIEFDWRTERDKSFWRE
jgi:hypothetical protein